MYRMKNKIISADLPRPIEDQSKQMKVNTGLVIIQMVDIDFEEKSINMNVEFIMDWQDQFIKIDNNGFSKNVRLLDINEIWSPDLYIYGLKTFTRRESSSIVLKKDDDGFVRVSYTFEVSFPIKDIFLLTNYFINSQHS